MSYLAIASGAFVLAWTAGLAIFLWRENKPGERLFNTAMGMVIAGPFPLIMIWLDAFTAFSLNSTMSPEAQAIAIGGFFLYMIIPAIIGDFFNL